MSVILANSDWLNFTKGVGLAVYGAALLACIIAAVVSSRRGLGSSARFWSLVAAAHLFFVVDIAFSIRHWLSATLGRIAREHQLYNQRHLPQMLVLVGIGVFAVLMLLGLLYRLRRRGWPAMLATAGAILSLLLFAVSSVSWHEMDALMYRRVGPTMVVAFAWLGAAGLVVVGAFAEMLLRPTSPATPARRASE